MRRVLRRVSIGAAYERERWLDHSFALGRRA
jgi:hypothetical protein